MLDSTPSFILPRMRGRKVVGERLPRGQLAVSYLENGC
jgi:hypothetical protein